MNEGNIIERAYELARSGQVQSLKDMEEVLKREGHSAVWAHLSGPSLRKELLKLIRTGSDTNLRVSDG